MTVKKQHGSFQNGTQHTIVQRVGRVQEGHPQRNTASNCQEQRHNDQHSIDPDEKTVSVDELS